MAYWIDPSRPLEDEYRRLVGELTAAIATHLEGATADHARGLHEARKTAKKLRALLRLLRSAAPGPLKTADAGFGKAARSIAGPREATALVETLERLIEAYPDRIVEARLGEIRAFLIRRRERLAEGSHALDEAIAGARAACAGARSCALDIDLGRADAGTLHNGVRKSLKTWAHALARARDTGEPEAFHDLRKAVKAHAAHLSLLEDFWPEVWRKRRKAVDALGETLGDLNDVHVMLDAVRDASLGLPDDIGTDCFRKLLRRERKRLARRSLAGARRLLDAVPEGLGKNFAAVAAVTATQQAA
jgi:CHAD domain-containing protein